ncbi:hypothetical protein AB688_24935 [Pseudomonas putida]|uniref:hypothetical protein n=1 Tax=Pseudomonas putida TaxID=303 RepID=UPI0007B6E006|nr:hypothetical protein [Pseudomonas putida]ANC05186.1 hypothetical protein AB688_24935 [Pseudomonas putida]
MSVDNDKAVRASAAPGSLAVFLPGVSPDEREDILLGNLYAQLTTREEFGAGLVTDWFDCYRRKLKFLGWDATPAPGVILPGPDRDSLKKDAQALISQYGSAAMADATQQALEGLAQDAEALEIFSYSLRQTEKIHFQLLPCVRHSGDYFDMVIYHMEGGVTARWNIGTLFMNQNPGLDFSKVRVELVRFNLRLFRDKYKALVRQRVYGKGGDFLRNVKLAKS